MNYDNEENLSVQTGTKLICYGNECIIQEVAMASGNIYAKLSYSTINGYKTGSDGWYSVRRLLNDENVVFTDFEKSEEYAQTFRELCSILFAIGSCRNNETCDSCEKRTVYLSDEELGKKIREFCSTYGDGGCLNCEGLAHLIVTSRRTYPMVCDESSFFDEHGIPLKASATNADSFRTSLATDDSNEQEERRPVYYISPAGFADCIDIIFSNYLGYIAEYHNIEPSRANITVDMLLQWLHDAGTEAAQRFGFFGFERLTIKSQV